MSERLIPAELRPHDGRFGSGPSKVRPEAVAALFQAAPGYLGTSHRRDPVRSVVGRLRSGLRALFSLPEDYEVVLGVGGATAFWEAMAFGLVENKSLHCVFGEFSAKCAEAIQRAPHLNQPVMLQSDPGTHPALAAAEAVDLYALTHNETSTGVAMPVLRAAPHAFTVVDATSAAGGLRVKPEEFDIYYFAPQKCFASDAGLWIALCSPAGIERIESIAASDRYIPAFFDLKIALDNSRKDQTYNTPPLAALFLALEQVDWMNDQGGLEWAAARCDRSAGILYSWAETHRYAVPFVNIPEQRSHVVGTIDFAEDVDASEVSAILRASGILDTEPYRKLGRNQLRIGLYPAIDPADVEALTRCIDYVIDGLD